MAKKGVLTEVVAIIGTLLVWLPLLAPVVFGLFRLSTGRVFGLDYLMPAELFPMALAGGGLLLWAALRARSRQGLIGWSLGLAVSALVVSQALAVVTGLATGETAAGGWQWAFVLGALGVYILALVVLGAGGLLLLRELLRSPGASPARP